MSTKAKPSDTTIIVDKLAKMKLETQHTVPPTVETKKELIKRIRNKMENYNSYTTWILDAESFKKDVRSLFKIYSNKFLEIVQQQDDSEIKHSALEVISRKFTQVYTAICLSKFRDIETLLMESKLLISRCCEGPTKFVSLEYLSGLLYCLNGLEAMFICQHFQIAHIGLTKLKTLDKTLVPFSELTVKGQVAVLAMKQGFIGHIHRRAFKEQGLILDQMIKMDPKNGDWHLWRHNVQRFQRKQQWYFKSPENFEISLIATAADLCPRNPRILIGLYSVLAEIVREQGFNWTGTQDLGSGRIFHSSVEIVQFLKVETRKVLVLDPMSVKVNITVAEIFSSSLPYQFLDVVFAKLCIERALLFHPNSSKANGRMGIFLLSICKNSHAAITYFNRSFENDRRNFPALLDLLMTYLSNHEVYRDKIEEILYFEMQNKEWTDDNLGRLYFVKGLHCYLNSLNKQALENWIITYEKCGDMVVFKKFANFKRKYGWRNGDMNLESMYFMARSPHYGRYFNSPTKASSWRVVVDAIREGMYKERRSANEFGLTGDNYPWNAGHRREQGSGPSSNGRQTHTGCSQPQPQRATQSQGSQGGTQYSQEKVSTFEGRKRSGPEVPTRKECEASKILGLPVGATLDEIKKQYRKLCFEVHPDKNPGQTGPEMEENLERMKRINVAYEELTYKQDPYFSDCSERRSITFHAHQFRGN